MKHLKKHVNDFGNDPVPSLVLRISIPFMFSQFVNVLYSIIDRIYIGNIPEIGEISLAGAGVCAPIITLLSSFGTPVSYTHLDVYKRQDSGSRPRFRPSPA